MPMIHVSMSSWNKKIRFEMDADNSWRKGFFTYVNFVTICFQISHEQGSQKKKKTYACIFRDKKSSHSMLWRVMSRLKLVKTIFMPKLWQEICSIKIFERSWISLDLVWQKHLLETKPQISHLNAIFPFKSYHFGKTFYHKCHIYNVHFLH